MYREIKRREKAIELTMNGGKRMYLDFLPNCYNSKYKVFIPNHSAYGLFFYPQCIDYSSALMETSSKDFASLLTGEYKDLYFDYNDFLYEYREFYKKHKRKVRFYVKIVNKVYDGKYIKDILNFFGKCKLSVSTDKYVPVLFKSWLGYSILLPLFGLPEKFDIAYTVNYNEND